MGVNVSLSVCLRGRDKEETNEGRVGLVVNQSRQIAYVNALKILVEELSYIWAEPIATHPSRSPQHFVEAGVSEEEHLQNTHPNIRPNVFLTEGKID